MCNPQYQLRKRAERVDQLALGVLLSTPCRWRRPPCIWDVISLKSIYKHKIELNFGANSQINGIKFGAFQPKGVNLHRFHGISF